MKKVFTSLDYNMSACPVCSAELSRAEYYLGKPRRDVQRSVAENSVRITTATATTVTFSEITKHTGSICVSCGSEKDRAKKRFGKYIFFAGIGLILLVGLLGNLLFIIVPVGMIAAFAGIIAGLALWIPAGFAVISTSMYRLLQ